LDDLRDVANSAEGVSGELCERLRMVLEPTLRGRLEGDYKTGKRIAMRKVLSWIASDYRKDRIWLRRTKPSKRTHRLIVSLDNSSSMKSNGASKMSLAATLAIYEALSRLEIGAVGVMSFGAAVRVLKHVDTTVQLSVDSLSKHFNFDEEASRSFSQGIPSALNAALQMFGNDEERKFNDMCLIVSDGRFDKEAARATVQEMLSKGQLPVLVIVDSKTEKSNSSVYDIKSVLKGADGKMVMQPFISPNDFPFPYYAVISSVPQLPIVLADLVKQWLELTSQD
jgi:midasin